MSEELVARYGVNVPRYTSYPTAPHFAPSVQGDTYRSWLGALDPSAPLSLYFHVPFCAEMCAFCGCHTKIVRRHEPVARYLETLQAEVDLVAGALPARFGAAFIHWGGGSPTMLRGEDWRRIHDHLHKRFDFVPDDEIAVELDPRTATEPYIRELAAAGVNRVSLGAQDFHPEVQAAIQRIQPFEQTARVVDWLRGNGIEAINIDLMYGLPFQNEARVLESIAQTVSLAPSRVALFGYAHVPWMKSHQKLIDEAALPGPLARFRQAEAAARALEQAGYRRIGLDHFALPSDSLTIALDRGLLRRNFQGYTVDAAQTLIGFGASAIGALPQGYVQNDPGLRTYAAAIAEGSFAVKRGLQLSADDRLRRDVIERLMCEMTVDLATVGARHGITPGVFNEDLESLAPLVADGMISISEDRLTMTEAGRPFVRVAAAAFDRYLAANRARHAIAV
jgi:oxygen-independent coproporphyrinogen-3 oxidase